MPLNNTIRYQSEFLRVIPVLWASYIRVTHPCAGRHQTKQALFMLPLDLHVLSLSLAFILSQDQTLHCTFIFFYSFVPKLKLLLQLVFYFFELLTLKIFSSLSISSKLDCFRLSKKLTVVFYYLVLILHFCCFQSFKELFPFLSKRTAKLRHFFELTKYFKKNIYFFFSNVCLFNSQATSLDCGCKVTAFSETTKIFLCFF